MRKEIVKLSYLTFALLLEELLSGPATAKALAEHTGMGHRYMCRLLKVLHSKRVIHISGWERDAIGRMAVRVYALGVSKDVKKPTKPRATINREYRAKAAGAFLTGTPFAGLTAMNDSMKRAA